MSGTESSENLSIDVLKDSLHRCAMCGKLRTFEPGKCGCPRKYFIASFMNTCFLKDDPHNRYRREYDYSEKVFTDYMTSALEHFDAVCKVIFSSGAKLFGGA